MALLYVFMAALLLLAFLHSFLLLLFRQRRSPLRHLPGPPSPSFFMGNLEEMHDQENNNLIANWVKRYGNSFVYRGFIGGCRLMTTDPVAVAHILGSAYDYPKPDFVRDSLASMAAGHDGLLTVEGEDHRRQRKILTPAFSTSHIKSLTPIFWDKATELRDIWRSQIDLDNRNTTDNNNADSEEGREHAITRVDALLWLGRATLDTIGLAGFGYAFNALTDDTNELARAFSVIFSTARKFRVMTILQVWFPFLRRFRRNSATMVQAQATMRRIGLALIEERRQAALEEQRLGQLEDFKSNSKSKSKANASPRSSTSQSANQGRDILSVLVQSNMSSVPAQRMSVEEVLCQISTFLAAGHETTSSALTWCLYALAKDVRVQDRLREALRSIETEAAAAAAAASSAVEQEDLTERVARCEYLDWVVRESLRVHAPVTNTMRVCMRDEDEIPLQNGGVGVGVGGGGPMVESGYVDEKGRRRWSIPVRKWDIISVPIQAINKSEAFWGPDAGVFRPERWAAPPQGARAIPGLYSNTLTFLNGNPLGGNRACIGYKFALIEIKIFLYVLVKDIEFSIDPAMVIEKKVNVVTRPFVKSEPHLGNQMPLNISRALCSASATTSKPQTAPTIFPPLCTFAET
ncbi:cytochrome P450 [Flammula alnicola]|nr:cytochrome P450 [Flammula alnicola]